MISLLAQAEPDGGMTPTQQLLADDPLWLVVLKVVALFAVGGSYLTPELKTESELVPWAQLVIALLVIARRTRPLAALRCDTVRGDARGAGTDRHDAGDQQGPLRTGIEEHRRLTGKVTPSGLPAAHRMASYLFGRHRPNAGQASSAITVLRSRSSRRCSVRRDCAAIFSQASSDRWQRSRTLSSVASWPSR